MNHARNALLSAGLLALSACASTVTLKPVTPQSTAAVASQQGVSAVNVSIADNMPADRAQMLKDMNVLPQLEQAVLKSFAANGQQKSSGVTLEVAIHAYRISNWGPSRMGVKVTVVDAEGNTIEDFERQTASTRGGSTATRTQRLAQDLVQKISDET